LNLAPAPLRSTPFAALQSNTSRSEAKETKTTRDNVDLIFGIECRKGGFRTLILTKWFTIFYSGGSCTETYAFATVIDLIGF
jgi:hypothetical protein